MRQTAGMGGLTGVVDEPLDLGLHAPVAELHLAELVGTHDGEHLLLVLLDPVVGEGPPLRLDRVEQLGVLFRLILVGGDGVLDDVDEICGESLPVASSAPPPPTPPCSVPSLCPCLPQSLPGLWASYAVGPDMGWGLLLWATLTLGSPDLGACVLLCLYIDKSGDELRRHGQMNLRRGYGLGPRWWWWGAANGKEGQEELLRKGGISAPGAEQ